MSKCWRHTRHTHDSCFRENARVTVSHKKNCFTSKLLTTSWKPTTKSQPPLVRKHQTPQESEVHDSHSWVALVVLQEEHWRELPIHWSTKPKDTTGTQREGHKILNKRHQRSIASSAPVDHSIPSITTSQDWCRTRSMKPPKNELQKRSRLFSYSSEMLQKSYGFTFFALTFHS